MEEHFVAEGLLRLWRMANGGLLFVEQKSNPEE
jgi:hypothetical protein